MLSSKNELEDSSLISALTVSNRWKLKRKKKSVNISVVTIFSFPSSFFFFFLSRLLLIEEKKSLYQLIQGGEKKGKVNYHRDKNHLFSLALLPQKLLSAALAF